MILNNIDTSSNNDNFFEVIHEVKNSIAVCIGYLDIIDYDIECDISKYVSIMKKEITRSMEIIGEFMLYRQFVISKNIININEVVREVCCDIDKLVRDNHISFDYNVLDEDIYINGDCGKLKQVFINLVKNSVESIEKSAGFIKIFGYEKDKFYYVVIRDNGCGMDKEILNKVINDGYTTKLDGNGIGVKFCQKIITAHNGSIKYESNVGSGTKVIVKIPIVMI